MFRTRWATVLACLIAPAVVTWVVSDLSLRHCGWVPSLTPWGAVVALVIAVVVLVAGLAVRRLRAHESTWMTPTGAATTAVAAQASAIVGALIGGVYAGELATALLTPPSPAMSSLAWSAGACLVSCLLWCGVGVLVEHWCAIDADDDDDHGGHGSESSLPDGSAPAGGEASS